MSTVSGCEMASITIHHGGGYRTASTTDPDATSVDEAQYDAQEGPCLDAVDTPVVYAQSFPDARWPALASRPTEFGVQSVLSYSLTGTGRSTADSGTGSLNSYGFVADAFDDEAQEIGLILAAHASVAARAVHERSALQQLEHNLNTALSSRDVIGQAKGILMERLNLPPRKRSTHCDAHRSGSTKSCATWPADSPKRGNSIAGTLEINSRLAPMALAAVARLSNP